MIFLHRACQNEKINRQHRILDALVAGLHAPGKLRISTNCKCRRMLSVFAHELAVGGSTFRTVDTCRAVR